MLAGLVHGIDRYCRSRIDDTNRGPRFRTRTNQSHPTVNAKTPRLTVTVFYTAGFFPGSRKVNVGVAMDADYASKPGGERRTGNITRQYVIHFYRQARRKRCESLLLEFVMINSATANDAIILENAPFQSSVANIKQQRPATSH
jgi:hypothetical protein